MCCLHCWRIQTSQKRTWRRTRNCSGWNLVPEDIIDKSSVTNISSSRATTESLLLDYSPTWTGIKWKSMTCLSWILWKSWATQNSGSGAPRIHQHGREVNQVATPSLEPYYEYIHKVIISYILGWAFLSALDHHYQHNSHHPEFHYTEDGRTGARTLRDMPSDGEESWQRHSWNRCLNDYLV